MIMEGKHIMFWLPLLSLVAASTLDYSFSYSGDEELPEECSRTTLLDLDFINTVPVIGQTWRYFQWDAEGNELTNDGQLTFGPEGAKVSSNPFTRWYAPNVIRDKDDLKWLLTTMQPIPLSATGKTSIEWIGTAKTFNTENSPFPASIVSENDSRLAAAVFNFQSTVTGIAFVWLLTNDRVYAAYRRTPYHRQDLGDNYYGFTYLFPVSKRKVRDWHHMRVNLDGADHSAVYILDGREVFSVARVGFKPDGVTPPTVDFGGVESDAWPPALEPAFGTVSNLYAYPANTKLNGPKEEYPEVRQALVNQGDFIADFVFPVFDPILGAPNPASYFDAAGNNQTNHIWGQGAELEIKRLRITQFDC